MAIIRYPQDAFEASLDGLRLWFDIVLPALLPFFTMADILMGLGAIHAVGVLLEPLMRPVFRIPGVGGFTVAMGLASGYPLGAKMTGQMRRSGLCTREEGERLLSFANTADPLFMVGAVAIGMFGMPQLGATIVVAHYIAAVVVGFGMRFHAGGSMGQTGPRETGPIFKRALNAMVEARIKDQRPFGQILSDAVKGSINAMLFVGGCIMIFSVLLRILTISGFTQWLAVPIGFILGWTGATPDIVSALVKGFMEITIGAQAAAQAEGGLLQKTTAASAIIAWSGLSVHAQAAAMVHDTDLRLGPYFAARFSHAVCAALLTLVLFEPLGGAVQVITGLTAMTALPHLPPLAVYWGTMAVGALGILVLLLIGSLIVYGIRRIRIVIIKV